MQQAEIVISVQKMQEYIEAHLNEKITLKQLANAAGYSPWHADRLFREITGKRPFDYIRALRLTKAALVLRDNKIKVVDVALDFVFDSQEALHGHFQRNLGCLPKDTAEIHRQYSFLCLQKFLIPIKHLIKEELL